MNYEPHPIAEIFPRMQDRELQELAEDIRQNGLIEPIVLHEDRVLDGRHRLLACKMAEVEPRFVTYDGSNPLGFVISKNLHRRMLTDTQRAMIAAEIADHPGGQYKVSPGVTLGEAAKLLNVTRSRVVMANMVTDKGTPAVIEAVKTGKVRVGTAARHITTLPKDQQDAALAELTENPVRKPKEPASRSVQFLDTMREWIAEITARHDDVVGIAMNARVELAIDFALALGVSSGKITEPASVELQPPWSDDAAEKPKPKPPASKPVDTNDAVAEFLAAGGTIARCPSTVNPTPEEREALAEHNAAQEQARKAALRSPWRSG